MVRDEKGGFSRLTVAESEVDLVSVTQKMITAVQNFDQKVVNKITHYTEKHDVNKE